MKNEKKGSCLARPMETQASDSTGFHNDSKAKLNQLLTLENVLEQYDESSIEKPEDVSLSGQFVMDLVDEIINMWQDYYDKMSDEDKNMLPLKRISFLGNNE